MSGKTKLTHEQAEGLEKFFHIEAGLFRSSDRSFLGWVNG